MRIILALLCLFTFFSNANAGVILNGTRVIFDGSKKESSIDVINLDKNEVYLIQSWIESDDNIQNQFIITPPLMRLEAEQKNVIRIIRAESSLPEDRESMTWLNIKAIPSKLESKGVNTLQLAIKNRIKLIYRPTALMDKTPEDVTGQLKWAVSGNLITLTNPTTYFMNFSTVEINGKIISDIKYIAPKTTKTYQVAKMALPHQLTWKLISDFGAVGPSHSINL